MNRSNNLTGLQVTLDCGGRQPIARGKKESKMYIIGAKETKKILRVDYILSAEQRCFYT